MKNLILNFIVFCLASSCSIEERSFSHGLKKQWAYEYSQTSNIISFPKVVNDSLILMVGDFYLTSLRTSDGSIKWRTQVSDAIALQGENFMIGAGYVFNTHVQDLRGWNLNTGDEEWRLDFPEDRGFTSHSTIQNNIIYYSGKSQVKAIEIFGTVLYSTDIKGGPNSSVISGNRIYCGSGWWEVIPTGTKTYGRITCLDAASGDSIWTFDSDMGGFYYMAPIVEDDVVFCGTTADYSAFYALDALTGQPIWNVDNIYAWDAILEDDVLYVNAGDIIAINKSDGTILWRTNLLAGTGTGPVAYLDGYIYHAHGGVLFILDAETGAIVHEMYSQDDTSFWYAVTGAGKVFLQSGQHLYCYDPWVAQD